MAWVSDRMKIAVDLHIHTALSACAEDDMTPNNIVNMALLKGLDAISITDHNACDNVIYVAKVATDRLLILPGMELQTKEEVHLLCYFPSLEVLLDFDKFIRTRMMVKHPTVKMPGNQQIINENDEVIGKRMEFLIASVDVSIDTAVQEIRRRGGVAVPAHIDRTAYGILSQLGFIPKGLNFSSVEISKHFAANTSFDERKLSDNLFPGMKNQLKGLYYYSSDAHSLDQILEREMFLEVNELSISAILSKLSV